MKEKYPAIRNRLLRWFDVNQRALPWRKSHTPYETWISEIMLQQTQIKTMLPFYHRWMARFPDIRSVAIAQEEEILKYWEGMGYYLRARNIHKTARIVMDEFGGVFPREYGAVRSLPGIGRYTAGAVMSFAYNGDYPVVDGNVERIFARLFNIATPVKEPSTHEFIWKIAGELLPQGKARRFNQALMDLGAIACLPRRPDCPKCPITSLCESHRLGVENERPVPGRKKVLVEIDVAVGVLERNGRLFIQKRPPTGLMAHLWEFPGGKVEEGETPEEALVRELREELEIDVRCAEKITVIRHGYTSFKVALHAFRCTLADPSREPVLRTAVEGRWVSREELSDYAFPAANRKLIGML
ncbi:MAG: A/G-specific adenine glycosylase [Acidobacteriota bacterium]